jgi:hypothetical protein
MRQKFVLKLLHQGFELSIEGVVKENGPSHGQIMVLKTYGVKPIFLDFEFDIHRVPEGVWLALNWTEGLGNSVKTSDFSGVSHPVTQPEQSHMTRTTCNKVS